MRRRMDHSAWAVTIVRSRVKQPVPRVSDVKGRLSFDKRLCQEFSMECLGNKWRNQVKEDELIDANCCRRTLIRYF